MSTTITATVHIAEQTARFELYTEGHPEAYWIQVEPISEEWEPEPWVNGCRFSISDTSDADTTYAADFDKACREAFELILADALSPSQVDE